MKNIVMILALFTALVATAQNDNSQFEKEGNLVKGTFFHDNGAIQQQGFYKKGKLHGEWISYNEAGEKLVLAQYTEGKKTGKWFVWNEGLLTEVDYDNNVIASVTEWSGKNTVVSK